MAVGGVRVLVCGFKMGRHLKPLAGHCTPYKHKLKHWRTNRQIPYKWFTCYEDCALFLLLLLLLLLLLFFSSNLSTYDSCICVPSCAPVCACVSMREAFTCFCLAYDPRGEWCGESCTDSEWRWVWLPRTYFTMSSFGCECQCQRTKPFTTQNTMIILHSSAAQLSKCDQVWWAMRGCLSMMGPVIDCMAPTYGPKGKKYFANLFVCQNLRSHNVNRGKCNIPESKTINKSSL